MAAFLVCCCLVLASSATELLRQPDTINGPSGTIVDNYYMIEVAGVTAYARCWNGRFVSPTLRLMPGDHLHLTFHNKINQTTNVHFHGFQVSPNEKHGDDVLLEVHPDITHNFDIMIPDDHPVGLYWYHAHYPRNDEEQVHSGMAGFIIIGDLLANFPTLKGIKQVEFQLKDVQLFQTSSGYYQFMPSPLDSNATTNRTVNGQLNPTVLIEENEIQMWLFANTGPNIYYNLTILGEGGVVVPFYECIHDGVFVTHAIKSTYYVLGPSSRLGIFVIGPSRGLYTLTTLRYTTGPQGDTYPQVNLARIVSSASSRPLPAIPHSGYPNLVDLRTIPVTRDRTVIFSETADGNTFFINGLKFDRNRVDFRIPLGSIERWTIVNTAQEDHWFHIHQIAFQVTKYNGTDVPFVGYQDTCNLPRNGTTVLYLPFTRNIIRGKFVIHCHIIGHEVAGMMAVVEVY